MSNADRKIRRVAEKKARKALQGQMSSTSKTLANLPQLLQKSIETNEKLVQANNEITQANEKLRSDLKALNDEVAPALEDHEKRLNRIEEVPEVFIGLKKQEEPQ